MSPKKSIMRSTSHWFVNPAIHNASHTSLHPSPLFEPRHPSLEIVFDLIRCAFKWNGKLRTVVKNKHQQKVASSHEGREKALQRTCDGKNFQERFLGLLIDWAKGIHDLIECTYERQQRRRRLPMSFRVGYCGIIISCTVHDSSLGNITQVFQRWNHGCIQCSWDDRLFHKTIARTPSRRTFCGGNASRYCIVGANVST